MSSVRRQLIHSRYATLAAMVIVDRIAVTTVPLAADASWCTSNVIFDSTSPGELAS